MTPVITFIFTCNVLPSVSPDYNLRPFPHFPEWLVFKMWLQETSLLEMSWLCVCAQEASVYSSVMKMILNFR